MFLKGIFLLLGCLDPDIRFINFFGNYINKDNIYGFEVSSEDDKTAAETAEKLYDLEEVKSAFPDFDATMGRQVYYNVTLLYPNEKTLADNEEFEKVPNTEDTAPATETTESVTETSKEDVTEPTEKPENVTDPTGETTDKIELPTQEITEPTKETTTEPKEIKLGDINGDNAIDSKDAVLVLKSYADALVNNKTYYEKAADVNNDGKVDSKDAVEILKTYAKNLAENKA